MRYLAGIARDLGRAFLLGSGLLAWSVLVPQGAIAKADDVRVSGELRQWHLVTLDLDGPQMSETGDQPNPFVDVDFWTTFTHESGSPSYRVPGYFAADGRAAETGANSGSCWRVHFRPDTIGKWNYKISFQRGGSTVLGNAQQAEPWAPWHDQHGSFTIASTDKASPDFRYSGRLAVTDRGYRRFLGTGQYFLKAGPDAPETLLAYEDFDGTSARQPNKVPLKSWAAHQRDWQAGDPSWREGKGTELIGAINYLSSKGCNTVSFLPYNVGGDGDNVWPFVTATDKRHYDCSKLDQWAIVFQHATERGIHLHFKLQENEIDDHRRGSNRKPANIAPALDGGELGPERRLYLKEMIARFGHALALTWNLGEENTQSSEEIRDMIDFIQEVDPYQHAVVIHTFPNQQDEVYSPLLPPHSKLTGASLQNSWDVAHRRTLHWIDRSSAAGRRWIVCNDEQNPASDGVPPDPGYQGHDGIAAKESERPYTLHDIRRATLWGTLLAGGEGVEYYFGYKLPENDLLCEDFRSRDQSWDYCRIALQFFHEEKIPFWQMRCHDELVGNPNHDNSRYCFAQPGKIYLVYLADGKGCQLDLSKDEGKTYEVFWFNPRTGEHLSVGSRQRLTGGAPVQLGELPRNDGEDWLAVVQATED